MSRIDEIKEQNKVYDKMLEITKTKQETKKIMEEIRHKHILEEIKALQKAKITQFVRQVREQN